MSPGRAPRQAGLTGRTPAAVAASTTTSRGISHTTSVSEITGRNKFGPQLGPWTDHEWLGWWGDEPPFHTPVFVMTHHERPSFTLRRHHLSLRQRRAGQRAGAESESGTRQGCPPGGGAKVIREFLDADLVDTLHVAVSDIEIVRGSRLWESADELDERFHHEVVPSPSGCDPPPVLAALTTNEGARRWPRGRAGIGCRRRDR